jgi:hypothetical protein
MNKTKIGRLALRHEGGMWNAYYAKPETMEGALLLASIRMAIVSQHPDRKADFMRLVQMVVADIVEATIGERPYYPDGPQPAPDHERAGHS